MKKPVIDWSSRYPKPLLDKLGVKQTARVTVLGIEDAGFRHRLEERSIDLSQRTRKGTDVVFYEVRVPADLDRLSALRETIKPAGAIWVVRAKGDGAAVKETDIITAAKAQGLVDIKVVSFSATQSALKLVIPVALR